MKTIKRILSFVLGAALSLSACFFAACAPADSGNGSNSSSSSAPEDSGGKDNEQTVALEGVEALREQEIGSVTLDGALNLSQGYGGETQRVDKVKMQGTVNPADGDGDIVWQNESENDIRYVFIRDWEFFFAQADEPTEDLSSLEYGHACNVLEYIDFDNYFYGPEDDEQMLAPKYVKYAADLFRFAVDGETPGEFAKTGLNLANAALFILADATGALEETDGKASIDLYKMAAQVKADALVLAESVTENTTTKDLLLNDAFKKYMEKLTQTVRVDEVPNLLLKVFSEFQKDFDGWVSLTDLQKIRDLIAIKPNIQSTAYEYIVKILTSDEAKYLLNSIFGIDFDCDCPLWTQTDFSDYAEFDREGMSMIREVINSLTVTEISAAFAYKNISLTVTDASVEYTLNEDNTVSALAVSGGFVWTEWDNRYEGEAEATLTFSSEKTTLTDADEYTVTYSGLYEPLPDGQWEEYFELNGVRFYPVFQDGVIVGFKTLSIYDMEEYQNEYNREAGTLVVKRPGNADVTYTVNVYGDVWTDSDGNKYITRAVLTIEAECNPDEWNYYSDRLEIWLENRAALPLAEDLAFWQADRES